MGDSQSYLMKVTVCLVTARTEKHLNPLFVVHENHVMHEIPSLLNCRYNTEPYFGGVIYLFIYLIIIRAVKSKHDMTDLCVFGDASFFGGCF